MTRLTPALFALESVIAERLRQDVLWGRQHHEHGVRKPWLLNLVTRTTNPRGAKPQEMKTQARAVVDKKSRDGNLTWADVMLAQVAELMAADTPGGIRRALVQIAAVSLAWIEQIDRS